MQLGPAGLLGLLQFAHLLDRLRVLLVFRFLLRAQVLQIPAQLARKVRKLLSRAWWRKFEYLQPFRIGLCGRLDLHEAFTAVIAGHFGFGQAGVLFAVDKLAQLLALAAKRLNFCLPG